MPRHMARSVRPAYVVHSPICKTGKHLPHVIDVCASRKVTDKGNSIKSGSNTIGSRRGLYGPFLGSENRTSLNMMYSFMAQP